MRGRAIVYLPRNVTFWCVPWMPSNSLSGNITTVTVMRYGYRPDRKGD